MADGSLEYGAGGEGDEINFTFEDGAEGNTVGDEFDFDLVVEEPESAESESVHVETATPGDGGEKDTDDIDYDDDEEISTGQDDGLADPALPRGDGDESAERANDLDEIDYDDDDYGAAADSGSRSAPESGYETGVPTHQETVENPVGELNLGVDHLNADPELSAYTAADFGALDKDLGLSFQDLADDSHIEGEITDRTFGNGAEGLDFDAGALGYTTSPPNVTVTWGDEVCPLFGTDESDPESYYLDDINVLDLPLSGFLATIRNSISKWVSESDEIQLRINELGIEFGETTTEALLGQSTFGHLIALHTVLLKNEDSSATGSLSLTLTTRPNCTLRVKELVEAANNGKGLSAVQLRALPREESVHGASDADDSPEVASNAILDETENQSYGGPDDPDSGEAGYTGDDAQNDLIDYEDPGYDEEPALVEEEQYVGEQLDFTYPTEKSRQASGEEYTTVTSRGNTADGHQEGSEGLETAEPVVATELDFLSYGDHEPQDHSAADELLDLTGGPGLSQGHDGQQENGNVTDVSQLPQHNAPGLSGLSKLSPEEQFEQDVDAIVAYWSTKKIGFKQTPVIQGSSNVVPDSGNPGTNSNDGTNGEAQQLDPGLDDDDGEYLDFEGDIEQNAPGTGTGLLGDADGLASEAAVAVTSAEANTSQRASTTPTLGDDEIGYEDDGPVGLPASAATGAAVSKPEKVYKEDEIDWDDEDKIFAPTAALPPTSNIPAKRGRDGDESDGLRDDGHDAKRQRPEHLQS